MAEWSVTFDKDCTDGKSDERYTRVILIDTCVNGPELEQIIMIETIILLCQVLKHVHLLVCLSRCEADIKILLLETTVSLSWPI